MDVPISNLRTFYDWGASVPHSAYKSEGAILDTIYNWRDTKKVAMCRYQETETSRAVLVKMSSSNNTEIEFNGASSQGQCGGRATRRHQVVLLLNAGLDASIPNDLDRRSPHLASSISAFLDRNPRLGAAFPSSDLLKPQGLDGKIGKGPSRWSSSYTK